jgi:hypothetical protein
MSFKGRIKRTINDAGLQSKYIFFEGRGGVDRRATHPKVGISVYIF